MTRNLLLIIAIIFASIIGQATNWHVDPSGTDDGSHGTTTGAGAFQTIQYAIDAASGNDVIFVAAGTYVGNLIIAKQLSLFGPNAAIDPNTGTRSAEAIILPDHNDPYNGVLISVEVSNVSIKGLCLDGDNPSIPGDELNGNESVMGVNVNMSEGIQNGPLYFTFYDIDHLNIENNIIRNFAWDGILMQDTYDVDHPFNYIHNNYFTNMWEGIQVYAMEADISDNVLMSVNQGIFLDAFTVATDPLFTPRIYNNRITMAETYPYEDPQPGQEEFGPYLGSAIKIVWYSGTAPALLVSNNVINCPDAVPEEKEFFGIYASDIQDNRIVTFENNTINGGGNITEGLHMMNCPSNFITLRGGSFNDIKKSGVRAYNLSTSGGGYQINLTLDNAHITMEPGGSGIFADVSLPNYCTPAFTLKNGTDISGAGATGILLKGGYIVGNPVLIFTGTTPSAKLYNLDKFIVQATNGYYVPPLPIDATTVEFDGKLSSAMNAAELFAVEDRIDHKVDLSTLGLVTVKANNVYVTPNSSILPATTAQIIQRAVNAMAAGGTVNIGPGTYEESNILVDKSLAISGGGIDREDVLIVPAAEDGNADNAFANNAQNGFVIKAHGVTIRNLTINGRGNPLLSADRNNFRAGIVTLDASQPGGGAWNNLHVDNVFIEYAYRRGVSVFPATVTGTVIENSRIDNTAFNHGMYLAGQSRVLNNTINHCFQGIVQAPDATTPAGLIIATGNTLNGIGNFPGCWGDQGSGVTPRYQGQPRAIQFNNSNASGRTAEIRNNTINDFGSEGLSGTVGIYTRLADANSVVENNTITLTSGASGSVNGGLQAVGMLLGWSYANGFVARGNHINSSGYGMGIMVFGSGTLAKPMFIEGNTITGTASTCSASGDGTGIYISNLYLFNGSDKNESYAYLRNNNAISGFVKGIQVEKVLPSTQPLTVIAHENSISGNTTGVDATTLSSSMDATGNWWGNSDGPCPPASQPACSGLGDKVTVNVNYIPWMSTDHTTIYVNDVTGNDANEGILPEAAKKTIQAGVDAVFAGGTVLVAAGNYTEQVTITRSLDLIGAGESTTTILAPLTRTHSVTHASVIHDYIVAAYAPGNPVDVRIQGFTVDAALKNKMAGTARFDGVFFRDIKNSGGSMAGLHSCTIHDFAATPDYESWGLEVFGDALLTINDNEISDYTRDGLNIRGDAGIQADPDVTISGNIVTGSSTCLNGINVGDGASAIISGNTVTGQTRSAPWAGVGIAVWSNGAMTISNNIVNGNYYGIDVAQTNGALVSENTLTDNISRAISLDDAYECTVSGNTISGTAGGSEDVAIGIANGSSDNMIGGATEDVGNAITMATAGQGNLYAIYMQADVGTGSNTIRYNTISGGRRAVQFDGPPGITGTTTISDNTISGQDFGGICAYNNGNLVISGNSLTNTVRPIEFFGPVNVNITGNTITGSVFAGINVGSYSGLAIIEHNLISGVPESNHGIFVQSSGTGLTIHGNVIHDIGERGIQVNTAAINADIDGNEIYDVNGYAAIVIDGGAIGAKINKNYIHDNHSGGVAANAQTLEFNENRVNGNDFGIEAGETGATFVLHNNAITGNDPSGTACTNPKYGVCSGGLSVYAGTADAAGNYWGGNGPKDPVLYPTATGNVVSSNVTFIPWWCDANMSSACPPLNSGMAIMNTSTAEQYGSNGLTTALSDAEDGQTLYVAEGTVNGTVYNIDGKSIHIIGTGIPGQSVLMGASPALTVSEGDLIIENGITFFNSTDAPTILVSGGSLKIRDCIIHEATNYVQSCLRVTGGVVDAGTSGDHGKNQFLVHGTGYAIDNRQDVALPAEYNDWGSANGPAIESNTGGDGGAIIGTGKDVVDYDPWGGGPITTAAAVNICEGITTVDIPVTVTRFNEIGSFSLKFAYTPGELNTPSIVAGSIPAAIVSWGTFSVNTAVSGTIVVSAFGPLPTDGVTLENGTTLFTLRFSVGTITTPALVSFVENSQGTTCEYTGVAPDYPPFGDMPTATNYINGSVTEHALPTITTEGIASSLCYSESDRATTLEYDATANSPVSFSIDWNSNANTAGLEDQGITSFAFASGGGTLTGIAITSSLAADIYYGTMTLTNASGCTCTQAISVTVVDDPSLSQPDDRDLCQGGSSITLTTEPTGGTGTFSFQWQYSATGTGSWSNILDNMPAYFSYTNSTTASLTISAGDQATTGNYFFRCILSSDPATGGCSATTAAVKVTVKEAVFLDSENQKSLTWSEALSLASSFPEVSVIYQLHDYTLDGGVYIAQEITLDLQGHLFDGGFSNVIGAGKSFSLTSSIPGGVFDSHIGFGDFTSLLSILNGQVTLGSSFELEDYGSSGTLAIGDGTSSVSMSINPDDARFHGKISRIKVSSWSLVNLSAAVATYPPDIEIGDGGKVVLSSSISSYDNTFISMTQMSASAAEIQVGASTGDQVELSGNFDYYYGKVSIYNGCRLFLNTHDFASNNSKFTTGGFLSSSMTTLVPITESVLTGYDMDGNTIELGEYGLLDLTYRSGDLTLQHGLHLSDYNSSYAPRVKFLVNMTHTNKIICSKFYTDENFDGAIDVSKNLILDFNNMTPSIGSHSFTLATITDPFADLAIDGTPVLTNAADWKNPEILIEPHGGYLDLVLYADYEPCVNPTDGGLIGTAQENCGAFNPEAFTNEEPPSGENGTIEYEWQSSTDNFATTPSEIGSSNSATYDPGSISESTCYRRLARVTCMSDWTGAAVSNVIKMTVKALPTTAVAGDDQDKCNTFVATLAGNDPSAGTGLWSVVTKPSGSSVLFSDEDAYNSTATVDAYGAYTFKWTITNVDCSSDDNVTINYYEQVTMADAGAASADATCDSKSYELSGNTAVVGTGTWTCSPSTNVTFVDANDPETIVTVPDWGEYTLTWTIVNGTCSSDDDIVVTFYQQVTTADAGAASADATCNSKSYVLDGNTATVGTGTWTCSPSTDVAYVDANDPETTVTVPDWGEYTLTWTIVNGTCSSDDDIVVTFYQQVTTADAGAASADATCNSKSYVLDGNTATVGTGTWSCSPSTNVTYVDVNDPETTVTVPDWGEYTLTWTIVNGTCSSDDNIVVTFYQQVTTADAGAASADATCDSKSYELSGNTAVVGTGTWTCSPSTNVTFVDANDPETTVTVPDWGEYTLTWTIVNGTCSSDDDIVVTFYQQVTTAAAGDNQNKCNTWEATLAANNPTVGTGAWSVVSKPALSTVTFGSATVYNTTATVDVYGAYTLKWTITNGACTSNDDVTINYYEQVTNANAGSDQSKCNISTFTLDGNAALVGQGTWTIQSGPGSISSLHSEASEVTGVTAGSSTVLRWTIVNGSCSSYDEVTLTNNALQSISGLFHYYNLANTLLTGTAITVNLYLTSDVDHLNLLGTTHPNGSGFYEFTALCPGLSYDIVATSTASADGSINTTDAAQVNYWFVGSYPIEKVRFYAGDVVAGEYGYNNFINSTDALRIQRNFVFGDGFDRPSWTFWKSGTMISSNPDPIVNGELFPSVTITAGSNTTANMYGLCTGDFNRSFNPISGKSESSTLELISSGTRQAGSNQAIELPIRLVNSGSIGAISMILDIPSDLVTVSDITVNGGGGQLDWSIKGNELRIGWQSMNPLELAAASTLLTLHLQTTDAFVKGSSVRLTLASSPLNELADDLYNVVDNAVLAADVLEAGALGTEEPAVVNKLTLSNFPNPFSSMTVIRYTLPGDGKVNLEIRDLVGKTVKVLVNETQAAGDHSFRFDAAGLSPGVYTATIRFSNNTDKQVGTIKMINNR